MRNIVVRLTGGVVALLILTACDGGQDSANSNDTAKQKVPSVASAPSLPGKPVCEAMTESEVSRIIGRTIFSSDDINFINSLAEPTICSYYTDANKLVSVDIQWMLEKDALWDDQIANLGRSATRESETVRVTGSQLGGDDAIKEMPLSGDKTPSVYWVLLKKRGLVVCVTGMKGLPDSKLRALTRATVLAAQKL